MTTYGLTSAGLVIKTTDVVNSDLGSNLQNTFGKSIPFTAQSLFGELAGSLAERYGEVWAEMQAVNASQDPDQATGSSLDAIGAIRGVPRLLATSSTVTLTACGTPTTLIAGGSLIATASTNQNFQTLTSNTIVALSAWVALTVYAAGNRVTNGGNCFQCTTGGTSAASGGPTGTGSTISDGSVVWEYIGTGTGAVDMAAQSVNKGQVVGAIGDITHIVTGAAGWNTVTNLAAAILGQALELDGPYRARQASLLVTTGLATQQAIRSAVLLVAGVTACTVLMNNTDTVDVNGQAPHSVQCVITGGVTQSIVNAIFATISAGINTIGSTSGTAIDSQGISHTINFSRLTATPIFVDITLKFNGLPSNLGGYPTNGDALVQAAIQTFGATYVADQDVTASALASALFPVFANGNLVQGVQGIMDVSLVKIGVAPSPGSSATIAIDQLHIATFSSANVTVHSSQAGDPL